MKTFDLIVIGSGSGLDVAVEAANRGLKVAIIERGPLGGTCLNRGCIPSKILLHVAEVADTVRRAPAFGIPSTISDIDIATITRCTCNLVDNDSQRIEQALGKGKNPQLFKGTAKFISQKTLTVNNQTILGKKILIAAGARTTIPPIAGLDRVPYLTSTEALRLTEKPNRRLIIGGGYIGAELGYFYAAMGTKITIIQRGGVLLSREDEEIAQTFTSIWKKRYQVLLNTSVKSVARGGEGVVVHVVQDGKTRTLTAEKLFIATGVTPNSDLLEVAKTGVKTNQQGFITVNQYLETSVKDIWALGDIAGVYLFKHSANLEADYVLHNILSKKKKAVDYFPMPHAVFTDPQIAGVGLTEQEAREQKKSYIVGKYEYRRTGMGAALKEKDGFVKFIVEKKTKEILGCHIIGPQASTLLHEVVVAMKANRKKALEILQTTVHVHPALSEVVQRAALSVRV